MQANLDRITEQLKELPLLRKQLGEHQGGLEQLAHQIGLAAELVEEVKKDQAEARAVATRGAPPAAAGPAEGGYDYRRLVKVQFPAFSGKEPKMWQLRCKSYFEFYQMPPELWVIWASFHMEGRAAVWMLTQDKKHLEEGGWDRFCQAVQERFGPDDYQKKLRALMELRQEGTVGEYRDQFEELMCHVMSFDHGMGTVFQVTMFLMGLRQEISAVVRLHRPKSVDDAAELAMLQEEVLEDAKQRAQRVDYEE
uniref:Uncharacterized protein n=1 Tax=Avena sativa TaxID=4498 RepID=A0ACD5YMY1_AVESA